MTGGGEDTADELLKNDKVGAAHDNPLKNSEKPKRGETEDLSAADQTDKLRFEMISFIIWLLMGQMRRMASSDP